MFKKLLVLVVSFFALNAIVEAGHADLKWQRNTDTVTAGYEIRYGAQYGSVDNVIDVGDTDHYTVDNLQPGVYFFAIRAYTVNQVYSGDSYTVADNVKLQTPRRLEIIKDE